MFEPIELLLFHLPLQELAVFLFVEGGTFVSEDVADKTEVCLFGVDPAFFLPLPLEELQLLFEGIPHFVVATFLEGEFGLSASDSFLGLSLLGLINKFAFELPIFSHFLLVEIPVVVVDILILFIFLISAIPVIQMCQIFLISFVFDEILLLFSPLGSIFVLSLPVEGQNHIFPNGFCSLLLFLFGLPANIQIIYFAVILELGVTV